MLNIKTDSIYYCDTLGVLRIVNIRVDYRNSITVVLKDNNCKEFEFKLEDFSKLERF